MLHFRGLPVGLDALVCVPQEHFGVSPKFSFHDLDPGAGFGVSVAPLTQGATRLRMTVARNTSPGIYKGSAKVGDKTYPVEIRVEPYIHLSVSPRQVFIEAHAGQQQTEQLVLANTGNVPCDIGETHAFGLFDVLGAERGIGAAFREPGKPGQGLMDRLADELARGHAGMVRLKLKDGAGPIAPGEVRSVRIDMRMPSGLKAGHTYSGTLPLHNLRYYVKVSATEAPNG